MAFLSYRKACGLPIGWEDLQMQVVVLATLLARFKIGLESIFMIQPKY